MSGIDPEIVRSHDSVRGSPPRPDRMATANRIVNAYVVGNMAGSALQIPVPLLDLAVSAGVQLVMLHALADTFEVPFEQTWVVGAVGSLIGSALPTAAAPWVLSSLARVIPVGTFVNLGTAAILIGASTYALGQVFISHFSRGGTFSDFVPRRARPEYERAFARGKQVAAALRADPAAG